MASAAISAVGAIQQGRAAKAASEFNATVAAQNADIARQNAQDRATQIERENYLRLGAIRASAGKSGGVANEGSVLDVLGDVAAQGELERQQALYEGELQARGFMNTSTLDTFSGQNAQRSSYFKAGSELLAGGASVYDLRRRMTRTN